MEKVEFKAFELITFTREDRISVHACMANISC